MPESNFPVFTIVGRYQPIPAGLYNWRAYCQKVPDRILGDPPLADGPTVGNEIDLETMRQDYFQAMDWDTERGKPSKAKLLELGLKNVAKAIWP